MDIFYFCWTTLLIESKKSRVFFDKNTCNVKDYVDENFNKPMNRISYLYKFGSYNISLFYRCFSEFCAKVPDSSKLIDNFSSRKNLSICSMSAGPGTDIIGLLYSLFRINKPLKNATVFNVISRQGSWRNLVTEMINSSIINVPEASTCKLLECDFLKGLSKKAQRYLETADILLMCNSFSSLVTPEKEIHNLLKRTIELLNPGAVVFFISSKEKSTYFKELSTFGSILFGPVEITLENMPYNEKIAELVDVKPLCSGTCLFVVWQKKQEIPNFQNTTGNNQLSLTKSIISKSDNEYLNIQTPNDFDLKGEFSSDTNISSSLGSLSVISSSNSSNLIIDRCKNSVMSDISLNFTQNFDFSETNPYKSEKNAIPSPQASNLSDQKKYELPYISIHKEIGNNGTDMDSLLKSFESVISKLERLIKSQVEERHCLSDQCCYQNVCHCRCSVAQCQFKENSSASYCHSVVCCGHNNTNHNSATSLSHNLFKNVPQEGPCLVIPLQNLSDELLTSILTLVSQNTSVNKTTPDSTTKEEK